LLLISISFFKTTRGGMALANGRAAATAGFSLWLTVANRFLLLLPLFEEFRDSTEIYLFNQVSLCKVLKRLWHLLYNKNV
jgi:hypothetical protein